MFRAGMFSNSACHHLPSTGLPCPEVQSQQIEAGPASKSDEPVSCLNLATPGCLALALIALVALSGCQSQRDDPPQSASQSEQINDSTVAEAVPHEDGQKPAAPDDDDYASRIARMYEEAKRSGTTTATNAGQWIAEMSGKATALGAGAAGNASAQLQQLYEQARSQGETSVNNTKQWAVEDFKKIGDWQYEVQSMSDGEPQRVAEKLNQMGSERWECFWIDRRADATIVLYFKRPMRSYIQRLPYRDVIRLLPMLGGGDEPGEP